MCSGARFTEGIGHNYALDVVLEGCANLHRMDTQKGEKPNWYPELAEKES